MYIIKETLTLSRGDCHVEIKPGGPTSIRTLSLPLFRYKYIYTQKVSSGTRTTIYRGLSCNMGKQRTTGVETDFFHIIFFSRIYSLAVATRERESISSRAYIYI